MREELQEQEKISLYLFQMKISTKLLKLSLGKSGLLIDGVTETVKHQIKQQEGRFLGGYDSTLGCFIDSTYGSFIDTTCGFFFDKRYI